MEQQHQLKYHGNFSLFEQNSMTAEERAWHLKRIAKELKDKQEREASASSVSRPSVPRPSVPRR